jgi:RNA polymerase sigma-70 factor, ECF subfamily
VILASRSNAAGADKHLPVFRRQKRHARFRVCNPASSEPRSSVATQSEIQGKKAFEEMAEASRSKFLGLANAILRNKEDAEDAVQNALLSGYLHLKSFDGRSALKTWFTRIVVNAALMIRRKRKSAWMCSQSEISTPDDGEWMQTIPTSQPDPEMVYAECETFQFVDEALQKMTPALRQAITMTYFDEMSAQEARALIGVSKAAFKSRLLRARGQLLNQVQHARVARIRRATGSFPYKNVFVPHAVGQPSMGSEEGS